MGRSINLVAPAFDDIDLEAVPLRAPSRRLTGEGQRPDPQRRRYLDLDRDKVNLDHLSDASATVQPRR